MGREGGACVDLYPRLDGKVSVSQFQGQVPSAPDVCMSAYVSACGRVCEFVIYIAVICICFGLAVLTFS